MKSPSQLHEHTGPHRRGGLFGFNWSSRRFRDFCVVFPESRFPLRIPNGALVVVEAALTRAINAFVRFY